jgi:hypothetical protein
MFSANENLVLRQHKRRIVTRIEQCIPEAALDMGTNVMVMQMSCKAPGCVPLETAVIIIFPKSSTELIPGLPESQNGGSYKTKILKPMADVTEEDVLEALPPVFIGGKRTMERLGLFARDVMIGQITQLFGGDEEEKDNDSTVKDREAMALYLQQCLHEYISAGCKPPPLGEPYPDSIQESVMKGLDDDSDIKKEERLSSTHGDDAMTTTTTETVMNSFPSNGNIVIRRKDLDSGSAAAEASTTATRSFRKKKPPKHVKAIHQALNSQQSNNISRLFEREHAPGVRQPGCPCCDPDNPSNLMDAMMML